MSVLSYDFGRYISAILFWVSAYFQLRWDSDFNVLFGTRKYHILHLHVATLVEVTIVGGVMVSSQLCSPNHTSVCGGGMLVYGP